MCGVTSRPTPASSWTSGGSLVRCRTCATSAARSARSLHAATDVRSRFAAIAMAVSPDAHRLQPHVERRREMAVRWLYQPHVAVHPTSTSSTTTTPGSSSSRTDPSTRRWPTATKSATRWSGTPRRRVRSAPTSTRPPTRASPSTSSCVTATRSTAPGTPNGRGVEQLSYTFPLKDILPWGRQEEWLDSPQGWPSRPTYSGWLDSPDVARLYGSGG